MIRVVIAALLLILLAGSACASDTAGFALRAGLGYDFMSQRYFLDSVVGSSSDSFLQQWALTTDYLNDVKGKLDLRYKPSGARGPEFRALYEQTPELLRTRLSGAWRKAGSTATWQSRAELDWRDRVKGGSRAGDNYLLGSGESSLRISVGEQWAMRSRLSGEIVDFRGETGYSYDYYKLGGKLGFERSLGLMSVISVDGFLMTRQVADSQNLSYLSAGGEGSFIGLMGNTELDIYCRVERKNYDREDGRDDYTSLSNSSRARIGLGTKLFVEPTSQLDFMWFNSEDPLNNDYFRGRFWVGGGLDWDEVAVAVGPEIDILDEQVEAETGGESYFEAGGKLTVDCLLPGHLFASAESSAGRRDIRYEADYLSDFTYERVSLLADWTVTSRLNLSLMAAAEWEWHDLDKDNSRLLLVSSSLTYSLK